MLIPLDAARSTILTFISSIRIRETHLVLKRASVPLLPALRRLYQDIHPLVTLTFDTLTGSFLGK